MRKPVPMVTVALAAALLVVVHMPGAVADVDKDPAPAITIEYGNDHTDFSTTLTVAAGNQPFYRALVYTVSDDGTFTPGPPPPPPGLYNGPFEHPAMVRYNDFNADNEGVWVWANIYYESDWQGELNAGIYPACENHSGEEKLVTLQIWWEDLGMEAIGVPPAQRHGTAKDAVVVTEQHVDIQAMP